MKIDDDSRLIDVGVDIDGALAMAEAFTTSGCPGRNCRVACNRPFGNERPSRPFRNFPLRPEQEDVALVRQQLWEGLR